MNFKSMARTLIVLVVMALVFTGCVVPVEPAADGAAAAVMLPPSAVKVSISSSSPAALRAARSAPSSTTAHLAAAEDLGANVEYVWSDWDPEKMVRQFQEAAATNPDGIAVMGHPGDDAFETVIDAARADGIIVTSQNTTLDRLEERYKGEGFGYVGQELYASGYSLGMEAFKRSGLQAGDQAMVWGLVSQPTRGLRTQGVLDALEESGMVVDYIEIDSTTNADAAAGTPTFTGYVSSNPDVKMIVTDHGALTATFETYLKAAGMGPDDIYAAGFDLSSATLEAIRGNWTDLVLDQQPFLQGYLPIVQICMTKQYGFSGLHIDTGSGFAHKDNVEQLAPLVEQQIR